MSSVRIFARRPWYRQGIPSRQARSKLVLLMIYQKVSFVHLKRSSIYFSIMPAPPGFSRNEAENTPDL